MELIRSIFEWLAIVILFIFGMGLTYKSGRYRHGGSMSGLLLIIIGAYGCYMMGALR